MDLQRPSEPKAGPGRFLLLGAVGVAAAVGITAFLAGSKTAADKCSLCTAAAARTPEVHEVHLTYTQLPVFPIQ